MALVGSERWVCRAVLNAVVGLALGSNFTRQGIPGRRSRSTGKRAMSSCFSLNVRNAFLGHIKRGAVLMEEFQTD